jgi:pyrroloquinoline quinone biosynthesis protein B
LEPINQRLAKILKIIILGSAAGGGFPQWNCRCSVCELAWNGDARVTPRTQSSVAVSADSSNWFLLNASPDLSQQIARNRALRPAGDTRSSPIRGVFLTNADVDHVAGLLSLRERQELTVFATDSTLGVLASNSIFRVLDPHYVRTTTLRHAVEVETGFGLRLLPFFAPGKVALHQEQDEVQIGAADEATLGFEVVAGELRLVYIPGCAKVNDDILARAEGADLLLFDGTTFTDDEMVRLGLSQKTAWRMGHMAISGQGGSLAAFAGVKIGRKIYTHINNSNPILVAGSPERAAVEAAGWEVAHDGMEIALQ